MFHYYDLEKKEIMNTCIFYMCVSIIIDFIIYLYFLFILILCL